MVSPLNVGIVCPREAAAQSGNRTTAARWQGILGALGHRAHVTLGYDGRPFDLLVVLHATKNAAAAETFAARYPERPLLVTLTGTDVYGDLPESTPGRRALDAAARIIALQPSALDRLAPALRAKAVVIHQSATPPAT
jgi:hypothetical protein